MLPFSVVHLGQVAGGAEGRTIVGPSSMQGHTQELHFEAIRPYTQFHKTPSGGQDRGPKGDTYHGWIPSSEALVSPAGSESQACGPPQTPPPPSIPFCPLTSPYAECCLFSPFCPPQRPPGRPRHPVTAPLPQSSHPIEGPLCPTPTLDVSGLLPSLPPLLI